VGVNKHFQVSSASQPMGWLLTLQLVTHIVNHSLLMKCTKHQTTSNQGYFSN